MADIDSYGKMNAQKYEYQQQAEQESLSPSQLHDLAMFYLSKTAYEGITPEQLVSEYFLAIEHITDHVRIHTAPPPTASKPQGFKLEDGIPH